VTKQAYLKILLVRTKPTTTGYFLYTNIFEIQHCHIPEEMNRANVDAIPHLVDGDRPVRVGHREAVAVLAKTLLWVNLCSWENNK